MKNNIFAAVAAVSEGRSRNNNVRRLSEKKEPSHTPPFSYISESNGQQQVKFLPKIPPLSLSLPV